jgi:hypothetical protein
VAPFDDLFQVTSQNYEFVISKKPPANVLYEHECSAPAGVLKKAGIHILPEAMP